METLSGPTPKKARKHHRCNYCGYLINVGDTYIKSTHVAFGEIYTWKSHQHCEKIAQDLNMFKECYEGLTSSDFIECIMNEYDNLDGPKMPRGTDFKYYLDFVINQNKTNKLKEIK
jgi:hypothetical protein